jgi:hypothetical protein
MNEDTKIQDFFVSKKTENKLAKLTIHAYGKPELDKETELGTFEAFYNPSTLSVKYGLKYDTQEGVADSSKKEKPMPAKGYSPTTYSFDLLFDGTGASVPTGYYNNGLKMNPPAPPKAQAIETDTGGGSPLSNSSDTAPTEDQDTKISVSKIIKNFLALTYTPNKDTHRAGYLMLTWGNTLEAKRCVMNDASITYELFDASGEPLRAKISCSFTEFTDEELARAISQTSSPDLTHTRTVRQGDTLPIMCERIYGDPKLYLQVAKFNKLSNYRRLVPGQKIYFPPLVGEKSKI